MSHPQGPQGFFLAITVVLSLFLSGCRSELATVQGEVTLDGEPLEDARIVLEAPDRPTSVGKSDAQGRYTVTTGSQKGMYPGDYQVAISAYKTRDAHGIEAPVPVLRTPKRYNSAGSSGLTAVIQSGRNKGVDFHLTTKP